MVLGMSHKVQKAICEAREGWLEALTEEVEADDVHMKGGQQGRELNEQRSGRSARTRGVSERGRGSYKHVEEGSSVDISRLERLPVCRGGP
jgi:hypothetical protein